MVQNKSVIFLASPTEYPVPGEHFAVETRELNAELKENDVLVRNLYLSLDPYMRGRMRDSHVKSYVPSYPIGQPVSGGGVSEVTESKNPAFPIGSIVTGMVGWEEYTLVSGGQGLRVIPNARDSKIPLSAYIGVLGMPGMTAYSSLKIIGQPKAGETIFISAAAGAVGQLVGQMAKKLGLRVIGSVGSDDKLDFLLKELKFDAAFNYKKGSILDNLKAAAPQGIDIYYENVGGEQLEAALDVLNIHGRIVACGMISQYNTPNPYGVKNLMNIVGKRITMRGFIVSDFAEQCGADFAKDVGTWLVKGEIVYKEDIAVGLDNAPDAFVGMLQGKNFGKQVVKVADL
ncbi:hypothetical protein BGZ99_000365 [Dissophora globulifera]|uniref:Enoyl reductase (ER) domain-containing protein n=1 Tax=Dissophora globulifera TaxID=979702 RepID=A0A9P6R5A8_9FUNG|nr:hypothetical protein BGZ99_000365 [Dissophora globulifera]